MRTTLSPLAFGLGFGLISLHAAVGSTSPAPPTSIKLAALEQVTVGPYDNFSGQLAAEGESLIFVRKIDLASRILVQNLKTGEVADFVDPSSDADQPVVSPDGRRVAFVSYRREARGQICWKAFAGRWALRGSSEPVCLTAQAEEVLSPFWITPNRLGFLRRDPISRQVTVIAALLNEADQPGSPLAGPGQLFSVSYDPKGEFLVAGDGRELFLIPFGKAPQVTLDSRRRLKIRLPGLTGPTRFSPDGEYLYFGHYLSDTNGDQVLDGNDNSIVFRLPRAALLGAEPIYPEQLTSAEHNCGMPAPTEGGLYLTCAFDGSLDIYRLPLAGMVPANWTAEQIWNAHQAARTYELRLLLLNNLQYRFGVSGLAERFLSNHLLAGDSLPSLYYLDELILAKPWAEFQLLKVYVEARENKRRQPQGELSRQAQEELRVLQKRASAISGAPLFGALVNGLLLDFLGQKTASRRAFDRVGKELDQGKITGQLGALPFARFLYYSWAESLARDGALPADRVREVFRRLMKAPELTEESQIFYAFRALSELERATPDLRQRQRTVKEETQKLSADSAVQLLYQAEAQMLAVLLAPPNEVKAAFEPLRALIVRTRGRYYLQKALFVRGVLNFVNHDRVEELNSIASLWLNLTDRSDSEFAYARENYIFATLNRAYSHWANGGAVAATGLFYGSIGLTNDLEAHFGFLSIFAEGSNPRLSRQQIDDSYSRWRRENRIGDAYLFAAATLELLSEKSDETRTTALDRAIKQLARMQDPRENPVRHLLLGYCHSERLRRTRKAFDFDEEQLDFAHRHLVMALDLGRDNERVRAAALTQLGLLHARVNNHAMASRYFLDRLAIGVLGPEDRAVLTWHLARSLYLNQTPGEAAARLEAELSQSDFPQEFRLPLRERAAYYRLVAGELTRSLAGYQEVIRAPQLSEPNRTKILFTLGYLHFKRGERDQARSRLNEFLARPNTSERTRLMTFGLLAQMAEGEANVADEIKWRTERAELLDVMSEKWQDGRIKDVDGLRWQAQNHLRLAGLVRDREKAGKHLSQAVTIMDRLVRDYRQDLSFDVAQGLTSVLALQSLTPTIKVAARESVRLRRLLKDVLAAREASSSGTMENQFWTIKLQLLTAVDPVSSPAARRHAVDQWRQARQSGIASLPAAQRQELDQLSQALTR